MKGGVSGGGGAESPSPGATWPHGLFGNLPCPEGTEATQPTARANLSLRPSPNVGSKHEYRGPAQAVFSRQCIQDGQFPAGGQREALPRTLPNWPPTPRSPHLQLALVHSHQGAGRCPGPQLLHLSSRGALRICPAQGTHTQAGNRGPSGPGLAQALPASVWADTRASVGSFTNTQQLCTGQ